jgi:NAD-dependent deacetylase sirtuin 2
MYETLRPELLTATEEHRNEMRMNPTVVFGRPLFLQNSLPCLELKRPFILGTLENKWKATIAHRFIELLHKRTGKLRRIYTQNIDGLEGQCSDLPTAKVIPLHGTLNRVKCELCQSPMNFVEFCQKVQSNIRDITGQDPHAPTVSTPIPCLNCGQATVKPDIILFHSPLPKEFFTCLIHDAPSIDLLFIIGTSLNVYPACELVRLVPQGALRVIINAEPVGQQLGVRYGDETVRDYFAQGMCEDVVLNLIDELGWMHDVHAHVDDLPQLSSIMVQERLRGTMKTL